MEADEIRRYVELGRYRCVYVDVRLMPEYPGIVRSVIFYQDNRVCVEFTAHGYDEGGYDYCCTFPSLTVAIEAIEDYLGKPIQEWINHNKTGEYPELPPEIDRQAGERNLVAAIINNEIHLPGKGDFRLKSQLPWRNIEEYELDLKQAQG